MVVPSFSSEVKRTHSNEKGYSLILLKNIGEKIEMFKPVSKDSVLLQGTLLGRQHRILSWLVVHEQVEVLDVAFLFVACGIVHKYLGYLPATDRKSTRLNSSHIAIDS
jgi:uncharacterized membrane protein (UPF0136 family)